VRGLPGPGRTRARLRQAGRPTQAQQEGRWGDAPAGVHRRHGSLPLRALEGAALGQPGPRTEPDPEPGHHRPQAGPLGVRPAQEWRGIPPPASPGGYRHYIESPTDGEGWSVAGWGLGTWMAMPLAWTWVGLTLTPTPTPP